jgi:ligand-binding sensor domain-containing protein
MNNVHATIRIYLVLILLLGGINSNAQIKANIRFKNLTTEDGLSQNTCMDMVQDGDGFVWIACENGLNKYDGFSFTSYSPIITNNGFVLNTRPRFLKLMNDGILWITYQDGNPAVCYHKSFGFETWGTHFLGVEYPDSLYLNSLLLCSDGRYWASISNQTLKQTQVGYFENGRFNIIVSSPIGKADWFSLWEDNNSGLWFIPNSNSKVAKINLKDLSCSEVTIEYKGKIRPVENGFYYHTDSVIYFFIYVLNCSELVTIEQKAKIRSIYFTGETLFYETENNVIRCLTKGRWTELQIDRIDFVNDRIINSMDVNHDGLIWIAVPGLGALIYSEQSNQFISIEPDSLNPESIANYSTNNVLCDSDGNVFLGSMYNGLSVYVPSKNNFSYPLHLNSIFNKNSISTLTIDRNGKIWCSSANGKIVEIDPLNDQYKSLLIDCGNLHIGPMLWDNDSVLWFGAREEGLFCYHLRTHKLQNINELFDFNYLTYNQKFIRKITKDQFNNLWVNTHDGLLKIPSDRNSIQVIHPEFPPNDQRNAFNYNFTTCPLTDGNLMIGAENGLTEIDQDGKWIRNYYPDRKNSQSISHKTIFSLMEDSKGRIWAGTYNGGLNCIDRKTGKCEVFTIREGLPDNSISGIQEDSLGNIWLVTETGLSCLNPVQKTFHNFTKDDGLPSNSIGGRSFLKINNRCFVAPTNKGLFTFDPIKMSQRKEAKRSVVITNFEVIGSSKDFNYFVQNNESIELQPKEKVFKIGFVAPTFDIPKKINYEYRVDGLHSDWISNNKNNELIFTNLPAGKYNLKIRVSSINNQQFIPKIIPLIIHPPFYKTFLFKLFLVISLLIVVVLFFLTRIHRLKKLERIRLQIANDLHDEIGSSLGTISFIGYEISKDGISGSKLKDLGIELNSISKSTVDSMRDIIWFINPQNESFEKLVEYMKDFAAKILHTIDFSFDAGQAVLVSDLHLRIKRNLYLIFKETLNNIVKHSKASKVEIHLMNRNNELMLIIVDNGTGFDSSKEFTGMGLSSITKRAKEIGGNLEIESKLKLGTTTKLTIPLWKKRPKLY